LNMLDHDFSTYIDKAFLDIKNKTEP
jgi:hypothetical protein